MKTCFQHFLFQVVFPALVMSGVMIGAEVIPVSRYEG